ncbi:hydrogenase maturation protease [candidate division WOR-3 bacterium]|nr:hydrogenase maturation protease [candidate division WOR-3 bacterium]
MDWKEELKKFIDNKTVIMGIGSIVRSDDGVGVFIAEKLDSMGFYNVIIAHQTPEHWLGFISKQNYEKVLIIDSVLFGGEKGEIKLFDIGEISKQFGLTHSSPLHLFSDFVSQEGSVKGIKILAVMPENMDIGESLSPVIERSAGEIIGFFKNFK